MNTGKRHKSKSGGQVDAQEVEGRDIRFEGFLRWCGEGELFFFPLGCQLSRKVRWVLSLPLWASESLLVRLNI